MEELALNRPVLGAHSPRELPTFAKTACTRRAMVSLAALAQTRMSAAIVRT